MSNNTDDLVPFVNTMTPTQLKSFVKKLWTNFHTLANFLEVSNPEITNAIDAVLDGKKPPLDTLHERRAFARHNNLIFEFDSVTRCFKVVDTDTGNISEPIKSLTYDEYVAQQSSK